MELHTRQRPYCTVPIKGDDRPRLLPNDNSG